MTTASAYNGFSRPENVQITNDGIAASTAPATSVTTHGRRVTIAAAEWNATRIPPQHSRPSAFGNNT